MRNTSDNTSQFYVPQELLQELGKLGTHLSIGIPKERAAGERRLALTPEAVEILVNYGHQVRVESEAGLGINYADNHFADAGAEIAASPERVYQSDVVVKRLPPMPEEVAWMNPRTTVCSFTPRPWLKPEAYQLMMAKRITAFAYEFWSDRERRFQPLMGAMAEIEGYAAITIAADLLSNNHGGKGILLGGIAGVSPAEVVVVGAGTAGTSAARAAMALGASVKVFDNDIARLRQLHRTLGVSLFASNFHPNVLRNAFQSADVVIGALHKDSFDHHFVIAEELIETMKKGSLIIDLRVTQGGCFETTCCLSPSDPEIFEQHGVLHFCRPFISNYVARTASMAFSNLMVPLLSHLGDVGNAQNLIKTNTSFKRGVYLYQGKPVNEYISNRFNLRSNNIDIYLTAF